MEKVMVGKKKKAQEVEQEKIVGYIHATLDATNGPTGEKFDSLLASLHQRVEMIEGTIKEAAESKEAAEADTVNEALCARAAEQLEVMKVELAKEVELDEARKAVEAIAAEKAAKKAAAAEKKAAKKKK